jgi:hypothetical protein
MKPFLQPQHFSCFHQSHSCHQNLSLPHPLLYPHRQDGENLATESVFLPGTHTGETPGSDIFTLRDINILKEETAAWDPRILLRIKIRQ